MNENHIKGAARNVGGNVEEAFGKAVGSSRVEGEGIIDQVRGTAENLYGDAKDVVRDAYDKASPAVRETANRIVRVTRENSVLALIGAGAVGAAIVWALQSGSDDKLNRR